MNPSHMIAKAVAALAVSPETMARAASAAEAAGFKEPDAAARFYKEWVNDLVVMHGRPAYRTAVARPDASFGDWLGERLASPYHVSFRAVDTVRAQHGEDLAVAFSQVRWAQEVAWASRMRGSDNDRVAFLAEMWLKAARRDPARLFRGLVDCYAAEAMFDPGYRDSAFHVLSADEIADGAGDERWRPLWLRFAEREFGRIANSMPRQKLTVLAKQVRDAEWQNRVARSRRAHAERLRRWRPALMVDVLAEAVAEGLSSDDVVAAEARFLADVEDGSVDLGALPMPPWQFFLGRLAEWPGDSPLPSPEEASRRLEAVKALPPSWPNTFADDFKRLGAADGRRLFAWFDAVVRTGERPPPADPVVDYAMFLIEAMPGDPAAEIPPLVGR